MHLQLSVTGVQTVEQFAAWQLPDALKSEVEAWIRLKHSQERDADQFERVRRPRSKLKKADKDQVLRTRRTRSYRLMPALKIKSALPESPREGSRAPT